MEVIEARKTIDDLPARSVGRLAGRVSVYSLLMAVNLAIAAAQSVIFAKVLSPSAYGFYAIALTVAGYGAFLQLGLLSGLSRELPWQLGRGEAEEAARLVGQCTTVVTALTCGTLLVFALAVSILGAGSASTRTALLLGGLLAGAAALWQIGILRLRAEQRVIAFPLVLLTQKLAIVTLGVLAALRWGFVGPVVTMVLVELAIFAYVTRYHLAPAQYFPLEIRKMRYLAGVGFPLMAAGALDVMILGMDRMFLMSVASAGDIGIYHFAALPITVGVAVGTVVNQYLSPKLLYDYGHDGSLRRLFHVSMATAAVIGGGMAAAWPAFIVAARHVVQAWLPAYEASLDLMWIFYIGGVFAAAHSVGIVVNAANRQRLYLLSSIVVGSLAAGCYALLVKLQAGLSWYAGVAAGALALGFSLHLAFAWYCARTASGTVKGLPQESLAGQPLS